MSPMINAVKSCLLALFVMGIYTLWYLFFYNGASDHLARILENGPQLLPGAKEPLRASFTGIAALDHQLKVLTLFFWTQADGSRPNSALLCFQFAGQVIACWGLLLIEALRYGNRWRVVSFFTIWGIVGQNLAFGVIMPVYLVIHLSTSPTVLSNKPIDFYVGLPKLASIPFSLTIGLILPTVMMALPAPSVLTYNRKQIFIAIWQFFPIWVELTQQITSLVMSNLSVTTDKPWPAKKGQNSQWTSTMRSVYLFLLSVAGITHISTMTLIAASKFFPGLFASDFVGIFNPCNVFLPQSITASTKMPSLGDGAFQFLQYDFIIGSTALSVWASALYINTYRFRERSDGWIVLFFYFLARIALLGPVGHAVACIWARDELVFKEKANKPENAEKAR